MERVWGSAGILFPSKLLLHAPRVIASTGSVTKPAPTKVPLNCFFHDKSWVRGSNKEVDFPCQAVPPHGSF